MTQNGGSITKRQQQLAAKGASALLLFAACGIAQGKADPSKTEAAPDYSKYTESVHIPFSHPVNFEKLNSLNIRASINGGPVSSFQVDTGSVGMIVSADEVPNVDPNAPAGFIKYSSSGLELDGVWTKATVTFPDAKDPSGKPVTAVFPVLAVMSGKATGTGVNAITKVPAKPHPHMFGIGFGRGADPHPERNPFLNLIEMQAGKMRRGYTITRDGYTLGLTPKAAGPGYIYQKLTERTVPAEALALSPGIKDWETAPGTVTAGTTVAPMGAVLMDTGLTNFMFALPAGTAEPANGEIAAGTPIDVSLLGGQVHYTFKVGDTANPNTPRKVTRLKDAPRVFVNTGLRALAGFDYLYDAEGGYLALRPVK